MKEIKPLSGFVENLPERQIVEDRFREIIAKDYSLSGFTSIDTPAIERVETLTSKGGDDNEIYGVSRLKGDRNEEIALGLRFDLTVPLARYVAQHMGVLNFPFRRQHISKSWRGERAQKGRYREFWQADIDIIGDGKLPLFADADVIFPIYSALKEMSFGDFVININNRKLLSGFLKNLDIKDIEGVIGVMDKKDKVKSIVPMLEGLGLNVTQIDGILNLIKASEELGNNEILSLFLDNDLLKEGLEELTSTYNNLIAFGVDKKYLKINPVISRGLNYYTGMVFETFIVGEENLGSIASGGRYENLCSNFTDKSFPGVGGSIGVSRLMAVLDSLGKIETKRKTVTEVLVLNTGKDFLRENLEILRKLRDLGLSTELFLDDSKKFAKQMKYANNKGIPYVVIFGENEKEKGILALKIMETGKQIEIGFNDFERFKEFL